MTSTQTSGAVSEDSGTTWTQPGAWRVGPGVWRIPLPLPMDGLRAVNVYAIETPDGLTLIVAGWAIEAAREQLTRSLADIGYRLQDIRRFLVTHVHRDHYALAVVVRRELGAHISLGVAEHRNLEMVRDRPETNQEPRYHLLLEPGAEELAREWTEQMAPSATSVELWGLPDAWLVPDQEIPLDGTMLRAVHTPGHTQGHVVFHHPEAQLLFAGDHVLPTITPSIGYEPEPGSQPLGDFLASLRKVRALPDAPLLPAHGPIARSLHDRVDQLLTHHDLRLDAVLRALRGGVRTALEVAEVLPWTRRERPFAQLDTFNKALATLEARAHLELLVARGRASSQTDSGRVAYSTPDRP